MSDRLADGATAIQRGEVRVGRRSPLAHLSDRAAAFYPNRRGGPHVGGAGKTWRISGGDGQSAHSTNRGE